MSSTVNSPQNSPLQSLNPSESSVNISGSCSKKVSNAARGVLIAIACYALAVVCYALTGSQILLAILAGVSLSLLLSAVCALAFSAKAPEQVEQQVETGPGGLPEDPSDTQFPDPDVPTQDPDTPPVSQTLALSLKNEVKSEPEPKPESSPESKPKLDSEPEPTVSSNEESDSDGENLWEPDCSSLCDRFFG